ncbi:kinesin-like protein KIN-6 [Citrus sinensis]|uniref:Kinesin-like protein KIN-6 n=1 Tax=Citrus sinensis TaxID=2711 RepID=A0ACB8KXW2_CITSI|nr:kinesin-like protein KIN-6 [Citrus sinensis]
METNSPPSTCPKTVAIRRNPHRKARPTPSRSVAIQNPTSPTILPQISSFPIDEILSIQIPQNPSQHKSSSATSSPSETLKVFLRIKPLIYPKTGYQNSRPSRAKNVWPQNSVKKNAVKDKNVKSKHQEDCITVNDHNSVTLSPPLALQTSKRIKSEVYQGFSYVFSADSSQGEVYEKMVNPLVEDFLKGKSGMLAALGPSGSGKTHTIFGCPREPGMVPIALKRIFKGTTKIRSSESTRSFYLSIFEIYSERGKGEKLLDLLPDGVDLCMQQSTIKGLQEIIISDAAQAESLIARAMLKRATAMTNSNNQSSRSQCIINLRCAANELSRGDGVHANDAVLTIIDLAGAEREKRTGNQGARLLESNFINNTSMVFGLCLRTPDPFSLSLPHECDLICSLLPVIVGAPKKSQEAIAEALSELLGKASPVYKLIFIFLNPPHSSRWHIWLFYCYSIIPTSTYGTKGDFISKQLTRYLRDYLEGKKRMTLILTVKSGEEDYLDTSYLLRQASPYMKIKFDNVEDSSNFLCNKRQLPSLSSKEQLKRVKLSGLEACSIQEGKIVHEKCQLSEEGCVRVDSAKERNDQIMQKFAKAMWNVLKEYNHKLKVAEIKIKSLAEQLRDEKNRNLEMEKQLKDLKSCCIGSLESSVDAIPSKETTNFGSGIKLEAHKSSEIVEMNVGVDYLNCETFECSSTPKTCNSTPRKDIYVLSQINVDIHSFNREASECNRTPKIYNSIPRKDQDVPSQINVDVHSLNSEAFECKITPKICNFTPRKDQDVLSQINVDEHSLNCKASECSSTPKTYHFTPGKDQDVLSQINVDVHSPSLMTSARNTFCKQRDSPSRKQDVYSQVTCSDLEVVIPSCPSVEKSNDQNFQIRSEYNTAAVCCINATSKIISSSDDDLNESNYQTTENNTPSADTAGGLVAYDVLWREHVSNEVDSVENIVSCVYLQYHMFGVPIYNILETLRLSDSLVSSSQSFVMVKTNTRSSAVFSQSQSGEEEPLNLSLSSMKVSSTNECDAGHVPNSELNIDTSKKPLNVEKPKRRLLPASSILLRDITALDVEDEIEKPKGNRNGKKLAVNEGKRTQGSISLLQLLKNNLNL